MWLALPAATGLALVSGPLVGILVGPALREQAAAVTPWIAMAAFFAGLHTHYFGQAFTLGRKTGQLVGVVAAPALLSIALNALLIPRFGLVGAAWGSAASYAVGAVLSAWLGRRVLVLPVPWTALARAGLASGVMAAAVLAVPAVGRLGELLARRPWAGCTAVLWRWTGGSDPLRLAPACAGGGVSVAAGNPSALPGERGPWRQDARDRSIYADDLAPAFAGESGRRGERCRAWEQRRVAALSVLIPFYGDDPDPAE
jgi:hypothetical protein